MSESAEGLDNKMVWLSHKMEKCPSVSVTSACAAGCIVVFNLGDPKPTPKDKPAGSFSEHLFRDLKFSTTEEHRKGYGGFKITWRDADHLLVVYRQDQKRELRVPARHTEQHL